MVSESIFCLCDQTFVHTEKLKTGTVIYDSLGANPSDTGV